MSRIKPNTARLPRARALLVGWLPVIGLMALIVAFSAQPKLGPPPGNRPVYFSGPMPIFQGGWDAVVKKASHVAGYGLLAVLCLRALRAHAPARHDVSALAVLIAVTFGLTDELHQSSVAGRHASVLDVGFDYAGAAAAVLAARFIADRRAPSTSSKTNSPRCEGRAHTNP